MLARWWHNLLSGVVSAWPPATPDRDGSAGRTARRPVLPGSTVTDVVCATGLTAIRQLNVGVNALLVAVASAVLVSVFAAANRWLPAPPRAARPGTAWLLAE